ncbi:MAG: cysteine desulfurase [Armatimonadetes bacterium]|nr:cysteine desulfurase [Armatimonadota bacterium]
MDLAHYFDNAATTPVDPQVLEAMLPFLKEACGNAHSIHSYGTQARDAVERAREQIALLVGSEDPSEILFTSGATESNNLVLQSSMEAAISSIEHSSVREPALFAGFHELDLTDGQPAPPAGHRALISAIRVNNETGHTLNLDRLAPRCDRLHSDLTQAVGKIPVSLGSSAIGLASFSAHKLYGPKGVGALYARGGEFPEPLMRGGGQEQGFRAGTLNVPGIVGFGEAARVAMERQDDDFHHAEHLRSVVIEELSGLSDWRINEGSDQSPFILSLSFLGLEGESLVLELDRAGYAISAGAACSSTKVEPSHVLIALGLTPEWARGTVRISFGRTNTADSAAGLARTLRACVGTLLNLRL